MAHANPLAGGAVLTARLELHGGRRIFNHHCLESLGQHVRAPLRHNDVLRASHLFAELLAVVGGLYVAEVIDLALGATIL